MAQSRILRSIFGGLLFVIGALLLFGGGKLVLLGGSAYYVLAGAACLLSGALIFRGASLGLKLYAAFLLATAIWAVGEVGMQFWQLLPRIAGPAVVGLVMAIPFLRRRISTDNDTLTRRALPVAGGASALLLAVAFAGSTTDLTDHDLPGSAAPGTVVAGAADAWTDYGRTAAGTRYSPADQITPVNASAIKQAWSYETGETKAKMPNVKSAFSFMTTPLMVDSRLFFCTPLNNVVALDADSGKQLWRFDPKVDPSDAQMLNCRGVSYHKAEGATGLCASRIIATTVDGRLFALDTETGVLCPGFGTNGYVSLKSDMGDYTPAANYTTSPPVIVGNAAVLGGYVRDNFETGEPSGVIRAYDVKTGRRLWAWDAGRADNDKPLAPGQTFTRGSPNAWSALSADPALGLVYVPTGNATPDHVGMHRTALDEKYASSIVALDAASGKVRWSFQTTRHDLWDYDIPAQPVLFNLPVNGGTAPAVAAVTKRGEIFILDRRTGQPLTRVVDRKVPKGDIPGEKYAPTQPYSVGFPSFNPPKLREADMWGTTPIDQLWCRLEYRSLRYDGDFTPPTVRGSLQYPGIFGVLNWGSVSIDEGRQLMIVNSSAIPQVVRLYPHGKLTENQAIAANSHVAGYLPEKGTPYGVTLNAMVSPLGIPCHAPPWGFLTAVDLNTRKIVWQRPLGTGEDSKVLGFRPGIRVPGIFNIGGSVSTKSGVVFIAATLDNYLRAFDVRSGRELWKGRLPAGGQATPMTYTSPKTGRQYVVIAAGGHGFLGTTPGDYVVAFALDKAK